LLIHWDGLVIEADRECRRIGGRWIGLGILHPRPDDAEDAYNPSHGDEATLDSIAHGQTPI
jgi:hypothetical protein